MKKWITLIAVAATFMASAQTKEEAAIRKLLTAQTVAWNKGDLEGFMQTYWHSDSLMFIGKSGIKWGWENTLNNYRKGYPDTAAMGQLSFDIITIKPLSPQYAYAVGKWMLQRSIGNLSGHFDLLLRKINGQWYIVADHSS